jgi:hypothetical protein
MLKWPKSRTLAISSADKKVRQTDTHLLLLGGQNGSATLEGNLVPPSKTKHTLTT